VILAVAVLLPEHVIQFGSERQFANEVTEGSFVEHKFNVGQIGGLPD
jgi:hypothetical protein